MKRPSVESIEITGSFVFEPFDEMSLTSMICASGINNKQAIVQALHWPKSDWKYEEGDKVFERNNTRTLSRHLHWSLDPKIQGRQQEFKFCVFSHSRKFYDFSGYREAMDLVVSKGYQCPKLAWFLAFVLQMPKDLAPFTIAAPIALDNAEQSIHPYFNSNRLEYDWNEGDAWSDNDLLYLTTGLLFGVKPVNASG